MGSPRRGVHAPRGRAAAHNAAGRAMSAACPEMQAVAETAERVRWLVERRYCALGLRGNRTRARLDFASDAGVSPHQVKRLLGAAAHWPARIGAGVYRSVLIAYEREIARAERAEAHMLELRALIERRGADEVGIEGRP